jgi:hypothetical protein
MQPNEFVRYIFTHTRIVREEGRGEGGRDDVKKTKMMMIKLIRMMIMMNIKVMFMVNIKLIIIMI